MMADERLAMQIAAATASYEAEVRGVAIPVTMREWLLVDALLVIAEGPRSSAKITATQMVALWRDRVDAMQTQCIRDARGKR